MSETNPFEFNCQNPKCKGHRLEEVMTGVTVYSRIHISPGGGLNSGEVNYGEQTNEGGEIVRYQCADCGEELTISGKEETTPVTTEAELEEWLQEHQNA